MPLTLVSCRAFTPWNLLIRLKFCQYTSIFRILYNLAECVFSDQIVFRLWLLKGSMSTVPALKMLRNVCGAQALSVTWLCHWNSLAFQVALAWMESPLLSTWNHKNVLPWWRPKHLVSTQRPDSHLGRRESGQIPIRIWCCILSSRILNEVGVNMIGTCSEKAGFR